MSPLRLAWLNRTRHKAATILTIASLALMVAFAGILLRTWRVAESRFSTLANSGDAILGAKADPVDMTLSALNLEGPYPRFIPLRFGVLLNKNWLDTGFSAHVIPILFCGKHEGRRVIGTTHDIFTQPEPSPGFALQSGVWPGIDKGIVLGAETARREKLHVGDRIPVTPWTSDSLDVPRAPTLFRVAGILKPMHNAWDGALFTNIVQAEALIGRYSKDWNGDWSRLVAHYFILNVPAGGVERVRATVDARTVVQVASLVDTRAALARMTATGRSLGAVVALLVLCLTAIAVAALILGRYEALTRHFSILEAVGYPRSALLAVLAWEGLLLGLGAVLGGAVCDATLFPLARRLLGGALPGPEIVSSTVWTSWPVWAATVPAVLAASLLSSLLVFKGRAAERLRGLG